MKKFFAVIFAVLLVCFLNIIACAQSLNEEPPTGEFESINSRDDNRRPPPWGFLGWEDRVLKKGPLAPSANDRDALKGFLREPNTGLIRLLPHELYDNQSSPAAKKLNIRGGGAYYSFVHLTHAFGYGSDIELDHNRLSAGFGGADYGMLTNLGDVPLEQITWADMRAKEIATYRPARTQSEARAERGLLLNLRLGKTFDGLHYQGSVPVKANSTYLLRSIVYRTSNVLVAFRLVRQDIDGSVIIAWKLLKRYHIPELKWNK